MRLDHQLMLEHDVEFVAVLGTAGDFIFVSLAEGTHDSILRVGQAAAERGFYYCGILAITKDDKPLMACEPYPDAIHTMMAASIEFIQQNAARIVRQHGDSALWLQELYALPDNRLAN